MSFFDKFTARNSENNNTVRILQSASSSLYMNNILFLANVAQFGGGMYLKNANVKLDAVRLLDNLANQTGGAIFYELNAAVLNSIDNPFEMQDCTVFNNSAFVGGGIFAQGNSFSILTNSNNNITQNTAKSFGTDTISYPVKMQVLFGG